MTKKIYTVSKLRVLKQLISVSEELTFRTINPIKDSSLAFKMGYLSINIK